VPPDVFDNIGQRVAAATVSAPRKLEVAKVYRNAAIELRENQSVTVNGVFDKSFQERARIVGTNVAEWRAFSELLSADVKVRWPMSRMTVADYFDAVAVGLEAKQ
jgi:hypothetical protein